MEILMIWVVLMRINKNMTVEPLLKYIKRWYISSSIKDSQFVLVSEHNNAGLKKLSQVLSEQTSYSSAYLKAVCLFKACTQMWTEFSILLIFQSRLTVPRLARVYCTFVFGMPCFREVWCWEKFNS